MIYLISNRTYPVSSKYQMCAFSDFKQWVLQQQGYELDIETNLEEDILLKEIHVIQFGSLCGQYQFVLDVEGLTPEQLEELKEVLRNDNQTKVGFYLLFEYSVILQCWGVRINNLFDVMIMFKLLLNGRDLEENNDLKLVDCLREYLGIEISKDEQTTFTKLPMSERQIIYAATDVMHLTKLINLAYSWELEEPYFEWDPMRKAYQNMGTRRFKPAEEIHESIKLRMRALPAMGEILVNPFKFNKETWDRNIVWAQGEADKEYAIMAGYIRENLWDESVALGFLVPEDQITIKWTSTKQRAEVLKLLYPDLNNFKMPALRIYEKTLGEKNYLKYVLDKQFSALNARLISEVPNLFEGTPYFQKKGELLINFGSPPQRLKLLQVENPELTFTNKEALEKVEGPLVNAYKNWVKKTKLVSSYGENFYKYICVDGNIRARSIDPVLVTGRIAIKKPGMQTIPADEGYYIGDRYREAFEAPIDDEGYQWWVSAVDFGSQELNIIADISECNAWIYANQNDLDIHSISSGLIFKDKWVAAGGDPGGDKAKVKQYSMDAKEMRGKSKTCSFGLAFGLGATGASKKMDVPIPEAKQIIHSFFTGLPELDVYFDKAAKFGQANGWIATMPPFNFRRYFPEWNEYRMSNKAFGSISRESKNFRIQSMGGEQSLQALYLIYQAIKERNEWGRVKIVFSLHDATQCLVRDDYKEEWGQLHVKAMEEGAMINMKHVKIPGDLTMTKTWTK